MIKRTIVGFLWTFAVYAGWKLGAGILGAPQYLDLLAMVASATLGGVIGWRSVPRLGPQRRVARIPDRTMPPSGAAASDLDV